MTPERVDDWADTLDAEVLGNTRNLVAACVAASAMLVVTGATAAVASRQPTLRERAAITAALPRYVLQYPVGCVFLRMGVAGRFAKVTPDTFYPVRTSCLKYAANGSYYLKKTIRWKVIFNGSDPPPCALGVPADLVAPATCMR